MRWVPGRARVPSAPLPSTPACTRSPVALSGAVIPVVSAIVLALAWARHPPAGVEAVVVALLAGSVLAAVHHAEVVAHRVGEPFGSLVLAVAVTVIEVGLIVMLMVSGGDKTATLARDTVFAAVMITCNGIVGLSLLLGARRYGLAVFNAEGSGAALATVATVAALSLVLPTFTTSRPGPETIAASRAALRKGLGPTQMVLLALTVVGALTVVPGRATRLQGAVHLVLLAAFLFLALNP